MKHDRAFIRESAFYYSIQHGCISTLLKAATEQINETKSGSLKTLR
jgi:hypothetical protein